MHKLTKRVSLLSEPEGINAVVDRRVRAPTKTTLSFIKSFGNVESGAGVDEEFNNFERRGRQGNHTVSIRTRGVSMF